ncbi:unnamed protein product [Camellia sinensis]
MTPHDKQVMMFSATLSKEICPVCKKFMQDVMSHDRGIGLFINSFIILLATSPAETVFWSVWKGAEVFANRSGDQSLSSLLVSLMRMHRKEKPNNFLEPGGFNLSSLIESLLKKFVEVDSGCMTILHKLAPEVVNHLLHLGLNSGIDLRGSASEGDKLKAEAREKQAAILEKMRAQQSKFLASINSITNDGLDGSEVGEEACPSNIRSDTGEPTQDVCSLCHDPNSKGPPSWEQVCHSDGENVLNHSNKISVTSDRNTASSSSRLIPSSQLNQLIQNVVNEFASDGQPREVNAFLEFIKARFPSVRNIQLPCTSNDTRERTACFLETLEEHMYLSIREQMHDNLFHSDFVRDDQKSPIVERHSTSGGAESLLLGKYIASLLKETIGNPSASKTYDGFGPLDCDGIHVSSCAHAVHQACLDRYLSSLKQRGEFLCPVCRGLANSALPALPGDSQKVSRPPMVLTVSWPDATGQLSSANRETDFLRFREALSLLRSAADVAGRSEILKAFPMHQNGRIRPNPESMVHVLSRMYFLGKHDRISRSAMVSHSIIMWDTLKYSLIFAEITSRCGRTSLAPNYGLNALHKELKSSSGFILSLLLNIVQSTRTKNSLTVLLRLRAKNAAARKMSSELVSVLVDMIFKTLCIYDDRGSRKAVDDVITKALDEVTFMKSFAATVVQVMEKKIKLQSHVGCYRLLKWSCLLLSKSQFASVLKNAFYRVDAVQASLLHIVIQGSFHERRACKRTFFRLFSEPTFLDMYVKSVLNAKEKPAMGLSEAFLPLFTYSSHEDFKSIVVPSSVKSKFASRASILICKLLAEYNMGGLHSLYDHFVKLIKYLLRCKMYCWKALELQAFLYMAKDEDLMEGYKAVELNMEDQIKGERSLWAQCQAVADMKLHTWSHVSNMGLTNDLDILVHKAF